MTVSVLCRRHYTCDRADAFTQCVSDDIAPVQRSSDDILSTCMIRFKAANPDVLLATADHPISGSHQEIELCL